MLIAEFHEFQIVELTPGDTWRIPLPIKDFVPVVGDTARVHVRVKADATAIITEFSTANGRIELNPGEIVLKASAAQSGAVPPGAYVWDLELTRAGEVDTILGGTMNVRRDVTR